MKIGKTIKFLNEKGTAVVKELRQHTVVVEDEFGFLRECAYSEILTDEATLKVSQIEVPANVIEASPKTNLVKTKKEEKVIVIDLHFGQLVDYPKQYTASEKLNIQLNIAKEALQKHRKPQQKIILIHGKGKGVLEQEVLKILENTARIKYKEADFNRYKLGAKEIEFI